MGFLNCTKTLVSFFDDLGLRKLKYYLAADFQAINIPLGLQGYSSTFCCPHCVKKRPYSRHVSAEKRTLGRIRQKSREFRQKLEVYGALVTGLEYLRHSPLTDLCAPSTGV